MGLVGMEINHHIKQELSVIKRLSILVLFSLFFINVLSVSALAAEINPDPSSYNLGSTSELSISQEVQGAQTVTDSSLLANTGEALYLVMAVAAMLVGLSVVSNNKLREKYIRYRRK